MNWGLLNYYDNKHNMDELYHTVIHYHTISINPSTNDARAVLPLLWGRIRSAGLGPVIPKDGLRNVDSTDPIFFAW